MNTIKAILSDVQLRNRILFVIGVLIITRILAVIPIPGVSVDHLSQFLTQNKIVGMLNVLSGGGISSFSIVMLGVGPYITGSIVMQLLTVLVPRLKEMYQEEGEIGRRRFVQYGRILTPIFAVLQGFALITLLERQKVIPMLSGSAMIGNIIIITAGTMLMMWLGEQINERGIGNGVSLIIFAGIVAALPNHVGQFLLTFDASQIPSILGFIIMTVIVIAGVVFVTEAERPIPVTYAKQARVGSGGGSMGNSTYLPLRLNQAGVIPIIFAVSILLFPQMIAQVLLTSSQSTLQAMARFVTDTLANQIIYGSLYFTLVVAFTYFYTAVTFDPEKTADNLQKNGAFIPGFRPGIATAEYIGFVLARITLVGAVFLGTVAVLPIIVQGITGITSVAVGGTSLLIVVSVVLDLIKKVDAQIAMREY